VNWRLLIACPTAASMGEPVSVSPEVSSANAQLSILVFDVKIQLG